MGSLGLMMRLAVILVEEIRRGKVLVVIQSSIKSTLMPFRHNSHAWLRWRRACEVRGMIWIVVEELSRCCMLHRVSVRGWSCVKCYVTWRRKV